MDPEDFVGREHELGALERHLTAARSGEGRVVLVDGEPGMGKTALAHELVRRARAAGVVTAWGACMESDGAPPYRPWMQILRALGLPSERVLAADAASRFQLFDEVVDLLRARAGPDGLLLVLDDLHWADVPSALLLQVLASEVAGCRLLVVGLYRRTEVYPRAELTRLLPAVLRERATSGLALHGLAPGEVKELVARKVRRPLGPELLRAVQRRAEGNPLFVVELARLAATSDPTELTLAEEVRAVIGRRLDRLPEETRGVLRAAAVLGRELSLGLLAEVAGEGPARIRDLLQAAIVDDLVLAGDGPELRFGHALTHEVVYGELSGAQRQNLHRRAAEALDAARRPEGDPLLDALAHHLRQAAWLGGQDKELRAALEATLRAACRASDQLAHEHAAFQYRQALELLPLVSGGPSRQEVLVELARCEFRSGAVADAWASCRAAADLARGRGDATVVADAAVVVRGIAMDPVCDEVHALCRDALTLLAGRDPVREARLLGQLAVTADRWAGRAETGLSERALLAAEATGDPDARFLALQARHADLLDVRYAAERLSIGERAVQLGRETGRGDYGVWGHVWRADAFWELSRRVQLDTEIAAMAAAVSHLREPILVWRLTMVQASLAMHEGRFTEARDLADRAREIGRRGGHQEADFLHVVFRSHLAPFVGADLEDVEAFVRRLTAGTDGGPFLARFWLATVLADMGRLDEASTVLASVVPHLDAFPRGAPEWIINLTGLADLCVLFDDTATASAAYADLLPFADRQAIGGAHTPSRGPVALYLGELARLLHEWTAAEAHLSTALHLATAMGSPPFEAITRVELARLLLARRRAADVHRAEAHLEAAIGTADRLGMAPLAADARALLSARRGGRNTPLSVREDEVAALVAEGLSNRQIASRLHLSERTVEAHVRSTFHKLGVSSRAGIASWFAARRPRD